MLQNHRLPHPPAPRAFDCSAKLERRPVSLHIELRIFFVAGMALILGIDRFMSMFRATVNVIGNGVATVVVSRWERELDRETLARALAR